MNLLYILYREDLHTLVFVLIAPCYFLKTPLGRFIAERASNKDPYK